MKNFHALLSVRIIPLMAVFIVAPASWADWPCLLGPQMNGVSEDTGLLQSWPENGPPEVWRVSVGEAWSGIAIADDRLYTMASSDEVEYSICFDAHTGDEIWRTASEGFYTKPKNGNGPRSTPLLSDGKVYTTGGEGYLMCCDAQTGEKIWGVDMRSEFGSGEPTRRPSWGYAASPLLAGSSIIGIPGGMADDADHKSNQAVVAFDKDTGETLWSNLSDKASYSTPRLVEIGGMRQVVCFLYGAVVGLDSKNGDELWRFPWETQWGINCVTPLSRDGTVFVSAAYGKGSVLLQISNQGGVFTAEELWGSRHFQNWFSTSILHDGYLYGVHKDDELKCVDYRTGEEKWSEEDWDRGQLLYADSRIIFVGEQGRCALLEPDSNKCVKISEFQPLEEQIWNVPALSGGRLFIRSARTMVCFDLNDRNSQSKDAGSP